MQACPVLELLSPGDCNIKRVADASEVRDFPAYRVFKNILDIQRHWYEDLVSFLIGCGFTFNHS